MTKSEEIKRLNGEFIVPEWEDDDWYKSEEFIGSHAYSGPFSFRIEPL